MTEVPQGVKELLNDPWKERHNVAATQQSIKELLADGTPHWVRFPEEYKSYVQEAFAQEKQISDDMAVQYRWDDQDILSDAKSRMVNPMHVIEFVQKLETNGVKCEVRYCGMPQTIGLWCQPQNTTSKFRYVCYLQVPAMYEWSVMRLNRHNIPDGEDYRGWRTAVVQLVKKDVLSEREAHRIFGVPSPNERSSRYFRSLWEKRNGQPYVEPVLSE